MYDPASEQRSWDDIRESSGVKSKEQIKYLARENFEFFIEHVLGMNTNSPVIQRSIDFHQNPEKYSETGSGTDAIKAVIMAPRGHSKTYSWTIAPILWVCYKERGKEVLLSSASNSQSKDILQDLKRMIELNDALNHLKASTENMAELGDSTDIQDWQTVWQKEEIVTTTDVTVKVKTFSDRIRSKHVDYVFLDDVLSRDKTIDKEKDIFYSTLSPIIENSGGVMQIVGTPLEYNDLMMELMDKDNFYTKRYTAYDQETEEVLWPDNWTYDSLMEKKKEIGPARFAKEYMTNPMSVDEQFFKETMIESSTGADWMHNPHDGSHDDWKYAVGVDIALQEGKDADYTVFTVLGCAPSGQKHLVNAERQKGMTPKGIAQKLNDLDNFYHFDTGLVEKNAIGEGVWKTIEEECSVLGRINSFDTTPKSRSEILSNLQANLNRGELLLHDYDPLMRELRGFRMNNKGKLEGREHDDTVMSLAIALRAVTEGASRSSVTILGSEDVEQYEEENLPGDDASDKKGRVGGFGGGASSNKSGSSDDSSPEVALGIV